MRRQPNIRCDRDNITRAGNRAAQGDPASRGEGIAVFGLVRAPWNGTESKAKLISTHCNAGQRGAGIHKYLECLGTAKRRKSVVSNDNGH